MNASPLLLHQPHSRSLCRAEHRSLLTGDSSCTLVFVPPGMGAWSCLPSLLLLAFQSLSPYQNGMVNTAQTALEGSPQSSTFLSPTIPKAAQQRPQLLRTTFHQFLSSVTKMPSNRGPGQEEAGLGWVWGHLGSVRKQRHECCCPGSFSSPLIYNLSPWSQVPRVTVRNTSLQLTTVIMHTHAQRLSLQ